MFDNGVVRIERRCGSRGIDTRRHHRVPTLRLIPNRLHTKLAFVQRAIHTQLNCKRLDGELRGPTQLTRTLRKNVKQSLLEPATLIALPLLVVIGAEVNNVFARNVSWTT